MQFMCNPAMQTAVIVNDIAHNHEVAEPQTTRKKLLWREAQLFQK